MKNPFMFGFVLGIGFGIGYLCFSPATNKADDYAKMKRIAENHEYCLSQIKEMNSSPEVIREKASKCFQQKW